MSLKSDLPGPEDTEHKNNELHEFLKCLLDEYYDEVRDLVRATSSTV